MKGWVNKLFIKRSDLFLRLLNQKWLGTEELVNGMTKLLANYGITSGNLLDLCCGNGRISIHMAKRGFKAVGIDISKTFLEDAKRRAKENGVSRKVTFLEGDARRLKQAITRDQQPFDVVVSAWTSIGFFSEADDLGIFNQARKLSRRNAILLITETMHTEYLSVRFIPTGYSESDEMVMLENREYDPITAQMNTAWTFYNKRGRNLEFIDKIDIEHHIYSINGLSTLLRKAGWETLAAFGNLATQQPMSPFTSMNLVAKAT